MLQVMPGGHCHVCHKNYKEWHQEHPCFKNKIDIKGTPCVNSGDCMAWKREFNKDKEIAICAAVRAKDGFVVRGHRHGHALYKPFGLQGIPGYENERPHGDDQGFVTSRNRYVTRKEAMELQLEAGIESIDPGGYKGDELYSEDLY